MRTVTDARGNVLRVVLVAGAYFATAKLGLTLAYENSSVTAVWPPTGIALAATLIWGYRIWPGIALGALLANSWTGVPALVVLAIASGNTLEAIAGAFLLRRVGFRPSLERTKDVLALVALGGLISTMVSATVGVAALHIGTALPAGEVVSTWRVWWLGDMGGDLLVAPVLLLLATGGFKRARHPKRVLEAAALLAALTTTSIVIFSQEEPVTYFLFPALIWAALRFRQAGAAVSSLIVAGIAIVFTASGAGPFMRTSLDSGLLLSQTFMGAAAVTALLLAAITDQQTRARSKLRKAHEGLEAKVRERTFELERSNAELALQGEIAANMAEGVVLVGADGTIAYANPTFEEMFGYETDELEGKPISVVNAPGDQSPEDVAARILSALERHGSWDGEIRNVTKDGKRFWSHAVISTFDHPELEEKVWVSVQRDITERKLGEESDQRLRALVEQASDGIVAATKEGIVTSWNPGAERLYGYSAEQMIGRSISRIIPDHRANEFDQALENVREEEAYHLETERLRRDGTLVWVSLSVSPIKNRHGDVVGCSAIYSDISERRRSEQELRRREAQLADAQRVAHIGSWEWDVAANEIRWSDELCRIHGLEPDRFEASFEAFIEGVHPDDREFVDGVIKKAFVDGAPFDYQHRCVRPGGEVRLLHAQGQVESDQGGRPLRMFGTCQDITDVKRLEEPMRHLASIVEASEDAIFSASREWTVTSWNPGAQHLLGYEPKDILGRPVHVLIPPDRRPEAEEIMARVLSGEGTANYETERLRMDGTRVEVSVTASPITDDEGTVMGCSYITRDITEQKRVREEADRLKDEFFATVSHELRTPLTSIIGYTDILLAGEGGTLTDQQRRFLEITERNAKRQLRLVGDMLFVSQAEAGEFTIELGSVDLDRLVAGCVEAARPAAEKRGIELGYTGARAPKCEADGDRLGQLVDNLVSNAIKFTPEAGRVTVALSVDKRQAVLEVANSGSFVSPADQERLFDRFYRTASANGDAIQGVGLGLTIAEAIVRAHGGSIDVSSDEESGTVFRVRLPLREPSKVVDLTERRRGAAA